MTDGIGLSVGANSLRAVLVGRTAMTRTPVLTRFPHRPPEVGVPSENTRLTERGLIVADFVDRVGDPVAIVASDGSSHRAEVVLADALRALSYALTGGRPAADPVGVTYPAHWRPASVEALRGALAAVPEFRGAHPVLLISDAVAAMTALQQDPGVPTRGIVALCDLGGTGTSITLVDAANGFQPVGPTVRYAELSGDLIDQALLTRVVGDLAEAGSVDLSSTSAIGSLGRLREQCRSAKERLSTSSVTSLAVDLPGRRTEVRLTRTELDDAIRVPLAGFIDELQDTLQRNGIRPGDLVAVASVGGGARIPIITTTLSEHLRVPVITSAQPELAAAIGGGMKAVRALVPENATAMAPAAAPIAGYVPPVSAGGETMAAASLAWSEADVPDVAPLSPEEGPAEDWDADPRPVLAFADRDPEDEVGAAPPWYRSPFAILVAGLIVVVAALGSAAFFVLRNNDSSEPPVYSNTPVTSTPPAPAAPSATPAPAAPAPTQAPQPRTVTRQAPPPVVTRTQQPPATEAPPPSTVAPPTSEAPPPSTEAPPPSTAEPTTQPPLIPTIPAIPTIPGLPPFIPQIGGGTP